MRERIHTFVQALRGRGVEVSLAEGLDAMRAVAAAGVEREVLREAGLAKVRAGVTTLREINKVTFIE